LLFEWCAAVWAEFHVFVYFVTAFLAVRHVSSPNNFCISFKYLKCSFLGIQ
jgi:hypothetical protein